MLSRLIGVSIALPPLLGMLVVGILLKNIPYNFGQFGRAECTADGRNLSFVDSINDLDTLEEHSSFKRSIPEELLQRMERSSLGNEEVDDFTTIPNNINNFISDGCKPRYIGHELDPVLGRGLRTLCLCVILLRAGLETRSSSALASFWNGRQSHLHPLLHRSLRCWLPISLSTGLPLDSWLHAWLCSSCCLTCCHYTLSHEPF